MPINLNVDPQANIGNVILRWQFREFRAPERSKRWWITAGLVTLAMLGYALFSGNFLFALILLMGGALFINETKRRPRQIDCRLTSTGIAVGKKFWHWKEVNQFWIAYHPPEITNLYLEPKSLLEPRLTIPLEKTNPLNIREHLIKFLNEDLSREDEPTSEALARLLKLQ
ncbi:MAG: hypothetical protein WC621_00655 [Patescibacteria group bacterium]